MSEILKLFFELILNICGLLLEAFGEIWFQNFSWPDTPLGRVLLLIIIVVFGGIVWWELR